MKHAFIIQVHAYPKLLKEILKILESSNHFFYINIDKKVDDKPFKQELQGIQNVLFTEGKDRQTVNHAGFSQIRCTLILLEKALQDNCEYFHSLSGQDFPCVSNQIFDNFFDRNVNKSFMHYDTPEEANIWSKNKYPERYMRYHFYDFPYKNHKIIKPLICNLNKICSHLYIRKKIPNVAAGWSWFSWNRIVVTYILDYLKQNPKFLKRFHYTSCCDEIIFHTILNDQIERLNIDKYNSLRFIEWHPKRQYTSLPLILNENEFQEIKNSNAFFCRKVHPQESQVLIKLLKQEIQNQKI